jgi:DNA-binding CsgD family transcriptional regulator
VVHRRHGTFTEREASLVGEMSEMVAHGIRRAILTNALTTTTEPGPPGLILLGPDDVVETVSPSARHWLSELLDTTIDTSAVPMTVKSVASQARRAASGNEDGLASVRLPTRSGGWLRMDASMLDDGQRVAVLVSAAREPEVAELIAQVYGLSARERELTRLVLHGRSTNEIAAALHVSPYTVQDHLKSIFEKVGVRSRRELVSQLFLQQCAPRLAAGRGPGIDGWFVDDDVASDGPT